MNGRRRNINYSANSLRWNIVTIITKKKKKKVEKQLRNKKTVTFDDTNA